VRGEGGCCPGFLRFLFRGVFFLLPSLCFADDWSKEDSYRQTALTVLLVADWGQTRWAIKQNEKNCVRPCQVYEEGNPILGKHPSIGKTNNLIGASIIGHAAIAYILPRQWREGWQYVWIGVEANAVNRNQSIGIKFNF